jgi:hypothetical protein
MLEYKIRIFFTILKEPLNFFGCKKSRFKNEYLQDHF